MGFHIHLCNLPRQNPSYSDPHFADNATSDQRSSEELTTTLSLRSVEGQMLLVVASTPLTNGLLWRRLRADRQSTATQEIWLEKKNLAKSIIKETGKYAIFKNYFVVQKYMWDNLEFGILTPTRQNY